MKYKNFFKTYRDQNLKKFLYKDTSYGIPGALLPPYTVTSPLPGQEQCWFPPGEYKLPSQLLL
ncbi:hypothetical protein TFKS16_0089 [Tannerella forsythia KS16]|uniref:Uncharacterized protein n=1 Tax=Tannerella forsythia (strain ATCC 43037 / JCM 10827 / CCUG 21028 A / KCTC 5666 / FDC 338) TaxID=203275 RepID=G8UHJ7_TANFA|nr:hypothetical protein BFO_0077 [Tannerella forsythia 92A2]BAR47674.1 hypothetical protein TF3313_0060 [Tannerella forsythia 3313]BAR50443.1 hypothetical protein TFKS16_0089 [Tannerella forsythia KS16]